MALLGAFVGRAGHLFGLSDVTRERIEPARKIVPIVSVQNRYRALSDATERRVPARQAAPQSSASADRLAPQCPAAARPRACLVKSTSGTMSAAKQANTKSVSRYASV